MAMARSSTSAAVPSLAMARFSFLPERPFFGPFTKLRMAFTWMLFSFITPWRCLMSLTADCA